MAAAAAEEQQVAREQHSEDQRRERDPRAPRSSPLLLITDAVRLPLAYASGFPQGGAHATRQAAARYTSFVDGRLGRRDYSMPRGPREAPERNWRTNWLSELNSSSAGPLSTMRPFHSTAMYSATRLADMMSCVMTT